MFQKGHKLGYGGKKAVRVSKKLLWKGIRTFCLDCVNGSSQEVDLCTDIDCPLYQFRLGRPSEKETPIYIEGTYDNGYGADYMVNGERKHWVNEKGWEKPTKQESEQE